MSESNEIASDAAQLLLRNAKLIARTFGAAGISSAAGAETLAAPEQLAQFEAVLDAIMQASCDQLRDAIQRAYPLCPLATAESAALAFLATWGKTTAAEGPLIARDDESGLEQLRQERQRLLAQIIERAAAAA